MKKIKLSPSALALYDSCPRCFWLDKNKGIKRPRGIFPSLPGGMDRVIKQYFDAYRQKGELPPEIEGKVAGKLFQDLNVLEKWRGWFTTDLCYKDEKLNAVLSGALDDCLVDDDLYIPLDYKTRGWELKDDPRVYYQNQLDCYCLMLEARGFRTKNLAYLIYYWPLEVSEGGLIRFHVEPIEVETDIEAARAKFEKAVELLSRPVPESGDKCEYCVWLESSKRAEN